MKNAENRAVYTMAATPIVILVVTDTGNDHHVVGILDLQQRGNLTFKCFVVADIIGYSYMELFDALIVAGSMSDAQPYKLRNQVATVCEQG